MFSDQSLRDKQGGAHEYFLMMILAVDEQIPKDERYHRWLISVCFDEAIGDEGPKVGGEILG